MAKLPSFCLLLPWVFSAHHTMLNRVVGTSPCLCPMNTDGICHGEALFEVSCGGWRGWCQTVHMETLCSSSIESHSPIFRGCFSGVCVHPLLVSQGQHTCQPFWNSPFSHNLCFIWQSPFLPCRPQPLSRHRKTGSHLTLRPTASTKDWPWVQGVQWASDWASTPLHQDSLEEGKFLFMLLRTSSGLQGTCSTSLLSSKLTLKTLISEKWHS